MSYVMVMDEGGNKVLKEADYKLESKLHDLIEENPELISIPGVEENDLFLLPIGREHKASDLLCVDNEGGVTILEFKLAKNQTMREIVAQIIDYASSIWKEPYDAFSNRMKEYVAKKYKQDDLADVFCSMHKGKLGLKGPEDEEKWKRAFREKLVSTLERGTFRLVILSDRITQEIKNAVEYLYSVYGMDIYCIEVEYFTDKGGKTKIMVPKTITFGKRQATSVSSPKRTWDYNSFIGDCKGKLDSNTVEVIDDIFKFGEANFDKVDWGKGSIAGSFMLKLELSGGVSTVYNFFSSGRMEIYFGSLKRNGVSEELRDSLRTSLNRVLGTKIEKEKLDSFPQFDMRETNLKNPEALGEFKKVTLEFIEEVKKENPGD